MRDGGVPFSEKKADYLRALGLELSEAKGSGSADPVEQPLVMLGEMFVGSLSVKAQAYRTAYASEADSKAAKKKRFYAVHYGELDGEVIKDFITESWTQCRRIVEGVPRSLHKSFLSHGKAREY